MPIVSSAKAKKPPLKRCVFGMMLNRSFDGEAPVLEIWVVWSTPSLPLLPGPLRFGVLVPIGQFDLFKNCSYFLNCEEKKILKKQLHKKCK